MLKLAGAAVDTLGARRRAARNKSGWPSRTRTGLSFFENARTTIRYRACGVGPTIVFAVDAPATIELYDELIAELRGFRVIVFEPPGFGFSVMKLPQDFQFYRSNDLIAEFLRNVAGESAILAFSCVLGLGAVDIAARYPDLVSHLIMLQTPSWQEEVAWKKRRDAAGGLAVPVLSQLLLKRMVAKRAPQWLRYAIGRPHAAERFCSCADMAFKNGATFALASAFQLYLTDDCKLDRRPRQSSLVIWGAADRSHESTDKHSTKLVVNASAVHTLPAVGHFPELENPIRVAELIREFLRS